MFTSIFNIRCKKYRKNDKLSCISNTESETAVEDKYKHCRYYQIKSFSQELK